MTTAEQLQTLSVFVPPPVNHLLLQNPRRQLGGTWRRFYAATAFADISGFTPLAEGLAAAGVRGAEELTAILNQVFEALITTVESHGGQVVKFGGDALSLIWPCEPEELAIAVGRAIKAAFAMQAAMARFATVSSKQGEFELKMKIGLSAGELLEVHAGGVYGRWEYVLAGAPMANMSHAENHAQVGQIVADETTWRLLLPQTGEAKFDPPGEEIAPGFYRLVRPGSELPPVALVS
ncbi:MAG TPA: adenylate/guanylate cyclase domain-containing protein, partial [Anaerolineae bacterium]|nr:adenylate/guanylate cyclase domain-containing protein [Anaerolineae bacterium]